MASPAPTANLPCPEIEQHSFYAAPGIQFGAFSQELSLSLGAAHVATSQKRSADDLRCAGGSWWAAGARANGVAHSWSPSAIHGLLYLSFGGWSWEWWPFGLEIALGGGGNAERGYGLTQLSYIAGITSRLELFATVQWAFAASGPEPEWISRGLFGFRYGFELGQPWRERVTRVREP